MAEISIKKRKKRERAREEKTRVLDTFLSE